MTHALRVLSEQSQQSGLVRLGPAGPVVRLLQANPAGACVARQPHAGDVMASRSSVLCPVDFSDASRGALRYARYTAEHYGVPLVIMTVIDPLLDEAARLAGATQEISDRAALQHFIEATFQAEHHTIPAELTVAVGKPAPEILRVARERQCGLIVMSSQGLSGVRKLFFGSTAERVLRESTVPVLVTPPGDPGITGAGALKASIHRVLVPLDFGPAQPAQMAMAGAIVEAIGVPLLLAYVVEPVRALPHRPQLPSIDLERRARAEQALGTLAASMPGARVETLVVFGDPAEEVAKIARDRQVGLILMGLHSSPVSGPRMGSVTYRVHCLSHTLVLAVPATPAVVSQAAPGVRQST
jgi:universal stress protein A